MVQNETTDFGMCDKNDATDFLGHMTSQVEEHMAELGYLSTYLRDYLPYITYRFTDRKIYFLHKFLHRWLVDQLYTCYAYVCVCLCVHACILVCVCAYMHA